jgi:hypothetical protein
MASAHADFAIESLLELETRFEEFLRNVPPDAIHMRVYSPVLVALA